MPGLSLDQNLTVVSARLRNFMIVAAYTVAGTIANLAIILHFAPGASLYAKLAMAMSVISVATISFVPAQAIFAEVAAAGRDRGMQEDGGHLLAQMNGAPTGLWTGLMLVFSLVVAIAQLLALRSL